jgi:hypothetical protein
MGLFLRNAELVGLGGTRILSWPVDSLLYFVFHLQDLLEDLRVYFLLEALFLPRLDTTQVLSELRCTLLALLWTYWWRVASQAIKSSWLARLSLHGCSLAKEGIVVTALDLLMFLGLCRTLPQTTDRFLPDRWPLLRRCSWKQSFLAVPRWVLVATLSVFLWIRMRRAYLLHVRVG